MRVILSAVLLAFAATVQAAEPPPTDVAVGAAMALVLAQRQAAVKPVSPAKCNCIYVDDLGGEKPCICGDLCVCNGGSDCRTPAVASPTYSILVISRSACVPCERTAADLRAHGDELTYDIFIDRGDLNAKYGVTAYPTILLLRDGKEVSRHVGYMSAADMVRWRDNPDGPQSRGESVPAAAYSVAQPTYQPMPMRWSSAGACST